MPKPLQGPQLIRVGERAHGDKGKYATDEYLLAPPGTIVAPRPRDEEPTPENAARAIIKQGQKLGMLPKEEPTMAGMPAFNAFQALLALGAAAQPSGASPGIKSQSASSRRSTSSQRPSGGPPAFRRMRGAQEGAGATPGAAVNPIEEALRAIQQVATAHGTDVGTAASMLLGNVSSQPPQDTIDYAEGGASMNALLTQLLGAAGLTGPDLTLAQLAVMEQLGRIDPRALGVTDPTKFRSLIGEGMGFPTLEREKQQFNQSLYGFSQSAPQRGNVPTAAG